MVLQDSNNYDDTAMKEFDSYIRMNRPDMYKKTSYQEVSESKLVGIVNKANELGRDEGVLLHIKKQQVYETVTEEGLIRQEVTKRKAIEGATMLTITGNGKDKLSARIFEKKDGTIGVVFCGTDYEDGHSFGDLIDDAKQIVHIAPTPLAYKEAAQLLRAIKEIYPNSDINVYGHSEGGGEAQYAVLHSGILDNARSERKVRCYGVNSAGLNGLESVNDLKDELNTPEKKEIAKKYIDENFVLIQNQGEWCSTKAYQFGKYILVDTITGDELLDSDGKPATMENVYGKNVEVSKLNNQHGVEETRLKMEYKFTQSKVQDNIPQQDIIEQPQQDFFSQNVSSQPQAGEQNGNFA